MSSWTDYIYCTKRADGTFSLRPANIEVGEGVISPKAGIRSPEEFVDTILEISDSIGLGELSAKSALETLDKEFAKRCREYAMTI